MRTVTVMQNQSMWDVSSMATGTSKNAYAIAKANGLSVTDIPTPGATFIIPDGVKIDKVSQVALQMRNYGPDRGQYVIATAPPPRQMEEFDPGEFDNKEFE
jgi:hypothetical protein